MKLFSIIIALTISTLAGFSQDYVLGVSGSITKTVPSYNFNVGLKINDAVFTVMFGGGSNEIDNIKINTFIVGLHADMYINDNFFIGSGLDYMKYDLSIKTGFPNANYELAKTTIISNFSGIVIPFRVGFKIGIFSPFIGYDVTLLRFNKLITYNNISSIEQQTNSLGPIVLGKYIRIGINFIIPL